MRRTDRRAVGLRHAALQAHMRGLPLACVFPRLFSSKKKARVTSMIRYWRRHFAIFIVIIPMVRCWLYSDGLFNCTALYDFEVDDAEVDVAASPFVHNSEVNKTKLRTPWHITKDKNHYHSLVFQKWLRCRQFSDSYCQNGTIEIVHDYGIGSSITNGALHLALALLQQKV